jgi:glycosyltransferase involved in cell wall biosynthesis
MPNISVIMPTYNRASVLPRAIASVLAQSEPDFELVIVDDGSTDGTNRVVASFDDPRIHLIRSEENLGGNWARNRGVEYSRSELICFLDSDDAYLPHKLESVVTFFAEHHTVDVWVDSFVCRDERDHERPDREKINPAGWTGTTFRTGVFERTISKATTALSVRKQALVEVGLFDETLHRRQDFDVILRLSMKHVCMTTDRVLWIKHEAEGCISRNVRTYLAAAISICERHPDYLRDHPAALYRDLRGHFSKLLKRGEWDVLKIDSRHYRDYEPFKVPLLRLLIDPRVSRVR